MGPQSLGREVKLGAVEDWVPRQGRRSDAFQHMGAAGGTMDGRYHSVKQRPQLSTRVRFTLNGRKHFSQGGLWWRGVSSQRCEPASFTIQ